ncbi:type I polyketide synthase [Cyanothece sp. BG0011]|uniref:type I polyketide synthase n=1 Tax=Cyanothece sp. BG0011 TaxID=2082950 RepID=UPI000D1E685F|nr:type I polyketide synthase [Cyanothece sp. BG0011]
MVNNKSRKDIAIIGMGCRFPGAKHPQEFWELLKTGKNAVTEVPLQRWDIEKYYHQDPDIPGTMNTRWGGFLHNIDQFDAHFFGISPRECQHLDPQQRLILEVAWEALEDGGIIPETLSGSQTGVFMGLSNQDYHRLLYQDAARCDAYCSTGTSPAIAANRLSYLLNLQGPSLTLDTACASSLVAVHLACGSLQQKESNLALVGGVNLIISPNQTIAFSRNRMMSPDGKCKTFDAGANGYVRGEGCGVVVLKPLEDAIRDGNNIKAIIRGSAINQDGLSQGLTAPNSLAQQRVIRQALANAEVNPSDISYVETHGTGTSLGDPIEVKSLKKVLMKGRNTEQTCWLGSVKTNIGHLESAAGIAGLIKTVLCLQNREIPAVLHFEALNPYISLKKTTFVIPTTCEPWNIQQGSRLAGVSSFSFGGTNAHLIVEEAAVLGDQNNADIAKNNIERPVHLLTLSAKTQKALGNLVQDYYSYLQSPQTPTLADICFSANTGRSTFEYGLAIVSQSLEQLKQQLEGLMRGETVVGCFQGQITEESDPRVAFLFTGQGSQYVNMGQQLYETSPIFRQVIDECDHILKPYLDDPPLAPPYQGGGIDDPPLAPPYQGGGIDDPPLAPPYQGGGIDETIYTQPALFSIEYALAKLWQSWGVHPTVVMGHSVGEYVAACIAGVFSLEDGLKLIAARGKLMQALPKNGSMVAVLGTLEQVDSIIKPYEDKVAIAAINGPRSLVISGENKAINEVIKGLKEQEIKTKKLIVSHAFHSPLMQPMLEEFKKVAEEINYSLPNIEIISNVTGCSIKEEMTKPDYWVNHVTSPVNFYGGFQSLLKEDCDILLEIGAKPILLTMGRMIIEDKQEKTYHYLPSLRPGKADWEQMLESLAQLSIKGYQINWQQFEQDYNRSFVSIPTYPWQRSRYWFEESSSDLKTQETSNLSRKIERIKNKINIVNHDSSLENSEFVEQIKNSFKNEQLLLIIEYVQEQVALVLGLDKSQAPGAKVGFFQMGMDSLMAVELRNKLEATFGLALSTTLAFTYPNIQTLSTYLLERLNQRWKREKLRGGRHKFPLDKLQKNRKIKTNKSLHSLVKEINQYSDEEVEALIKKKITEILNE